MCEMENFLLTKKNKKSTQQTKVVLAKGKRDFFSKKEYDNFSSTINHQK